MFNTTVSFIWSTYVQYDCKFHMVSLVSSDVRSLSPVILLSLGKSLVYESVINKMEIETRINILKVTGKTTLETSGEDVNTTLETSREHVKTTLETSGEHWNLHSKRV